MALRPKYKKPKKRRGLKFFTFCLIIGGLAYFVHNQGFSFNVNDSQSVQAASATNKTKTTTQPSNFTTISNLPEGAAAIAIGVKDDGNGVISVSGDTKPRPIASISKVITAMALLEKYPIKQGESGSEIPITTADEQLYDDYVAKNGTVIAVKAGTSVTLHDALGAMLMMSANNMADTAAIWGFGSLDAYHKYANDMLQRYGLTDTTVGGDASGLDPQTKSTPSDLVKLGEIALDNPVFAEIVSSTSGSIAYAGEIPNYNGLVLKHGFNGIKHGDSIEAGITLLFSTQKLINGKEVTIVGSILGADNYIQINQMALDLVDLIEEKTP